MKYLFISGILFFLIASFSCHAQKMVQKTSDAQKLELNKEKFIGKPLKVLLSEIAPQINFVYGNPENSSPEAIGGTHLVFHFVDFKTGLEKRSKKEEPLAISVTFKLDTANKHKPLPEGRIYKWTDEYTKEYGDMIILKIRVTGNAD